MSDSVIIRISVESPGDCYTVDTEIDRKDWEKMTPDERVETAEDCARTEFFNTCNYGYTVIE